MTTTPYMNTGPTIKKMDILDVTSGMIIHQINPHVMGAGLALLIKRRYPQVYMDFLSRKSQGVLNLGHVIITNIDRRLSIASYVGQPTYGRGGNHTAIGAIDDALFHIHRVCDARSIEPIYVPYKMGCGLAGGDWDDVAPIIRNRLPDCIICKL